MSDHPRMPLVFSTPHAAEQAATLLARPVENAVRELIEQGAVREPRNCPVRVGLGNGVVARVARTTSRLTGRKAWVVIDVAEAA